MATTERLKELVDDVRIATLQGKLKWSETAEPDEFIAVMSGAKFFVKSNLLSGVDDDGESYEIPTLELHRRDDDALLLTIRADQSISWSDLKEIYVAARHKALGVDDAVDEVLMALKKL